MLELPEDLLVLGETAFPQLGIHQLPVNGHLETAPARRDEDELPHIRFLALEDLFRQTDGFGFVPSHGAVFDPNLLDHLRPPWVRSRTYNRG